MRGVARPLLALAVLVAALLACAPAAHAAPPAATGLPTITGTPRVGQTLTSTTGAWSGTTPMTHTRRWLRCLEDGSFCVTITGASSATYVLTAGDQGSTIRVAVTASNVDGEATSTSAATPAVAPKAPPVLTEAPAVSGIFMDGQQLSVTNGTWSGTSPFTYTRRWLRCDASGSPCLAITPTGTTHTPGAADVGSRLAVQVTATNADGSATTTTAQTSVIAPAPPANTGLPTTGGTLREGQTVTSPTPPGTWTGTAPLTFARQWLQCDASGAGCTPISGATGTSYVPAATDVGRTLRLRVTAANASSTTATATSNATAVIAPKAPPSVSPSPSIAGTAMDGAELTGSEGTWTGTAPITRSLRWLRCTGDPSTCAPISGQTTTKLKLTPADVGTWIRFEVTAVNADGTTVERSDPTAVVDPAPPASTVAPAVSGVTREGQVLTATRGTWTGTPTIAYEHRWYRCAGTTCAAIDDATATTYRLGPDDVGSTIRHAVVASNASPTTTTAWSAFTATVTPGVPVNTDPPALSGPVARDGETWTGTVGSWVGTAPLEHRRQWLRCSSTGTSCAPISGAIDATYRMTSADVGKTVRLEVATSNSQDTVKALSAPSPVVVAAPPVADAPPAIAGELRDTALLTATGTWSGTAPITLSHTWQRCQVLSDTCTDIPGATAATYRLTAADSGFRVRVRVGAVNAGGGGAATSAISAIVQPDPPRSTALPVLAGTAVELDRLTVSSGTWSGTAPLGFTYQWQRCDDRGLGCADIPGATGASRVLDRDDRGATLRAVVTATNGAGSDTAVSALSAVVAAAPPRNTVAPAVSPDTGLRDGVVVTATGGGWTGSDPLTLAWRWQRCDDRGVRCDDIAGAGTQTYTVVTGDVGFRLRAVVTATTPGGQASQASALTGVVGTNPPANTVLPALTGTAEDGAELRTDTGTWTGLVPMTPAYRWWRCDAAGANCGLVDGATGSAYRLTPADVGLTLRSEVVQTNAGGTTGARSEASAVVAAAPPRLVVSPRIVGGAAVGKLLTADPGIWSGTPDLRYDFVWLRCDAVGDACAEIDGARASTYRVAEADDDGSLRVKVTASNAVGTVEAESRSTAQVQSEPPVNVEEPRLEIAGLVADGTQLTANPGAWGGALPMEMSFVWRRCDANLAACATIAGAEGAQYRLTKDDVGKRVFAIVTAENVVDVGSAQTEATPVVLPEPPSSVAAPLITAPSGVKDGAKLSAGTGSWKGAAPLSYTVRWLRCDEVGAACAEIADATANTYTLTAADVGSRIRVRVTARNAAAEAAAESAATGVVAPALPASTARPAVVVIDGKPKLGGRLRAATGTWNGTGPLDIDARWQRCAGTSLSACDDIPGADAPEYVLGEADIGRRLRIVVTAANAAGTVTADSAPTEPVPAVAPDSETPPAVTGGPAREGVELSASRGTWTGTAPMEHAFAWERCNAPGAPTCAKIANATRSTYTLTATDVGKYVRVSVTATNAGGKATRSSLSTQEVGGVAPRVVEAPTAALKGDPKVGAQLSATTGRFAGTLPLKTEVRWQRCDARGVACSDIAGATKASYTLKAEDLNGTLLKGPMRAVVSATNVAGFVEAPSNVVGTVVTGAPGAAGDGTAGAGGAATAAKRKKKLPKAKVAATVKRIAFSARGELVATLTCPRKARGACGVTGSIVGGKVRHGLAANGMKKGSTLVKRIKLKPAELKSLRRKRVLNVVLRVAAPATPTRPKVRRLRLRVPSKLSGLAVKKRKSAAKKTRSTPRP